MARFATSVRCRCCGSFVRRADARLLGCLCDRRAFELVLLLTHKHTCHSGLRLVSQGHCSFVSLTGRIAGVWPVGTSFLVVQDGCVGGC